MPRLNLKQDIAFKYVFSGGDLYSLYALSDLLKSYIGEEIEDLHVMNSELPSPYLGEKSIRMDSNVTFNNGMKGDIEMQYYEDSDNLKSRSIYYLSKLYASQNMKGKEYDALKPCYLVLIMNFNLFKEDSNVIHHFNVYDEEGVSFEDQKTFHIVTIELSKVKEKAVKEMSAADKWNYFLHHYENEELKHKQIKKKSEC